MFSSNTTQVVSAAAVDPDFEYVTMLLHGDGTNGAQNNTFLDSSTNNFTITRNGNTTQGSFSPYGPNWSNFFDGTGDYLTVPSNAAFAFGTGDFTIEGWVFVISAPADLGIFQQGTSYFPETTANSLAFGIESSGVWQAYAKNTNANSTISYARNAWTHFALVRSGTTTTLYINGVSAITFTADSTNYTGQFFGIGSIYGSGRNINAYISNLRVVKGTAVYTASFTPPTTPLTAISGTSLLTCADNRFIDDSTNNFAITRNGDVSVQRFSPFAPPAAYNPATIGGSGYFVRASSQYLTVPNPSGQFAFGTGAFTIECWVNLASMPSGTGYPASYWLFGGGPFNSDTGIDFYLNNTQIGFNLGFFSAPTAIGNHGMSVGAWYHVAVVRGGGSNQTVSIYVNGTRVATASGVTATADAATSGIAISAAEPSGATSGNFDGYISNHRVVKGTAVYDPTASTLTVPTAPLSAITNTSLLLNFTNGAIFDNAMMNDLETIGNAQISTSVVKFGTGSLYFDGTGDYLDSGGSTVNFVFGTGDFTVEFWMYLNSTTQGHPIDFRPSSVNGAYPTLYITSNTLIYFVDSSNRITSSSLSTSTWYHVAISRSGTSTKMFINGTQNGSTYTDSTNYLCKANGPRIGANDGGTGGVNGYIDDLRITKGVARYTSNFTPPTAAFPNN